MDILDTYFQIVRQFPNYERRPSQEQMIREVHQALGDKQVLVVEAGTGSGKSFGYLIPLLASRLQGGEKAKPIVITTATIALQEQLLQKDIPFLVQALGREDLKVQLVKGRRNYLCIQKLTELEKQVHGHGSEMLHINYLKSELQRGWDGDFANLDIAVPPEIWREVQSDSEDCLGRKCRYFDQNPYRIARDELAEADLIIANHALYFQDLSSGHSLLPDHDVVVFDEAHQVKQYATSALTVRIGKFATQKLLQKIHRRLQPIPEHFHHLISDSEAAIFEWLFRAEQQTFRLVPDDLFMYLVGKHISVLQDLEKWLVGLDAKQLMLSKDMESELDKDRLAVQRDKLISQLQGLTARWEYFLEEDPFSRHRVNWAEVDFEKLYYEIKSTPLDIADILKAKLWEEKTAILTSATLAVSQNLGYIRRELGIAEATESVLPSPFNYEEQCILYLPRHLPDPNSGEFILAAAEEIDEILKTSQGRALVLFTSYQSMQRVSSSLIPWLPFPARVQGELPRNRLIDWFKSTPNSVLFATATFWEGIDIPGDSLSCVIMDKIPFAPPGDPVNQAMVDFIKSRGEDWFSGYVLPQAAIKIKQGFGRLIRTQMDRGIVAILDPRISQKGYGKIIQRSLPNAKVMHTLDDLDWEALFAEGSIQVAS